MLASGRDMGYGVVMYVTVVPNRNSPPAILLREGYREGGKVRNRTLANLSRWPPEKVEALRQVLKGATVRPSLAEAFSISRTRPHGHVAAVLGTAVRIGLPSLIDPADSRNRDLVLAMVVNRVIEPGSKLACARAVASDTRSSTMGEVLQVSRADEDDLYAAMDWLLARQERIEDALAAKHLQEGTLVLYDVSSAALEGRHCELGRLGYPRDGVKGRLQIVYGLLTTKEGCPVAVEVFEGNTSDPATVSPQVAKIKDRFGLSQVVLVGDRGMITQARITSDLTEAGLHWITALRAPAIRSLVEAGTIQISLFDQVNLAEVRNEQDYPGERLVVCRNPAVAAERARKREALLASTEAELHKIEAATARDKRRLKGKDKIGVRVGRVINKYKVAKHFITEIGEERFSFRRNEEKIAAEAALDGIYVIRTSVGPADLSAEEAVRSYKRLQRVERAFRIFNGDLDVRPIHHRKADRVRAHLLLCMLAHYVEWHMLGDLAPMLFSEEDPEGAEAARPNPVDPPVRSAPARSKARRKRTEDGHPVHSFRSLLADLRTVAANRIEPAEPGIPPFDIITTPTPLQERAFALLGVSHRLGFTEARNRPRRRR
ncbi:MAG: IS1634 family transposase [Actinobacteria bacterium]|nr:IS1634 family transposase [Actinomycetota bacterium]